MSEEIFASTLARAQNTPFFDKVSIGLAALSPTYVAIVAITILILVIWHLIVLLNVDAYVPSPGNPTTNIDTAMIWDITASAILIGGLVLLTYDVQNVIKLIRRDALKPGGSVFTTEEELSGLRAARTSGSVGRSLFGVKTPPVTAATSGAPVARPPVPPSGPIELSDTSIKKIAAAVSGLSKA